jgi:hypothetical protein
MIVDALNARTTPRAKRDAAGKIAAKPNYILLAIGLVLVLLQTLVVSGRVQSPVANATLLALGITFALYGVYPVSIMNGEFTGPLGKLAVSGPAALGLFLFAYVLHSLNDEAQQQQKLKAALSIAERANDIVLLTTSTTDQRHNSRMIGDTTIRLLDVDSFADERITQVIDKLDSTLQNNGVSNEKERKQEVRRLLASVTPHLRLGQPYQAQALAAVDAYLRGQTGANTAWEAAIANAAANAADPRQVNNRVKKLPFAVMKVTEKSKQPSFIALSESGQLTVGLRTYGLSVIANPAKRYMPNLEEAIVLTAAAR